MNFFDHFISFLLAVLLHLLGLLIVGSQALHKAEAAATVPELEVTSVELSLAEAETDAAPGSQNPEPQPQSPDIPTLTVPEPVEPAPPELLPDKPDFTEALPPPPPLPVLQPQPSPVVVPKPEIPKPAPTPVPSAPMASTPAPNKPASVNTAPPSNGPQATLQPIGGGGGAYGRVDGHPSLERAIKPNYPIGARRRSEEGTVILDVTVDEDGRAGKISLVSSSGFPDLDHAAERAAGQARFKPGTRNGKPIESAARLTIIFRLRDS